MTEQDPTIEAPEPFPLDGAGLEGADQEPKIVNKENYELKTALDTVEGLLKRIRSGQTQQLEIEQTLESIWAHLKNTKEALEHKE